MINKVGRDIPDEIFRAVRERSGYNGPDYRNGTYYVKAAPRAAAAWKVPKDSSSPAGGIA